VDPSKTLKVDPSKTLKVDPSNTPRRRAPGADLRPARTLLRGRVGGGGSRLDVLREGGDARGEERGHDASVLVRLE
jgi:hypothetical protein